MMLFNWLLVSLLAVSVAGAPVPIASSGDSVCRTHCSKVCEQKHPGKAGCASAVFFLEVRDKYCEWTIDGFMDRHKIRGECKVDPQLSAMEKHASLVANLPAPRNIPSERSDGLPSVTTDPGYQGDLDVLKDRPAAVDDVDLGSGQLHPGLGDQGTFPGAGTQGTGNLGAGTQGTGNLGAGTLGTGTLGTGTLGTGNLGTGTLGTGTLGAGTLGTGTLGAGTLGTGTLGARNLGSGTQGTGNLGTGNLGIGTQGTGDQGSGTLGTDDQGAWLGSTVTSNLVTTDTDAGALRTAGRGAPGDVIPPGVQIFSMTS